MIYSMIRLDQIQEIGDNFPIDCWKRVFIQTIQHNPRNIAHLESNLALKFDNYWREPIRVFGILVCPNLKSSYDFELIVSS